MRRLYKNEYSDEVDETHTLLAIYEELQTIRRTAVLIATLLIGWTIVVILTPLFG